MKRFTTILTFLMLICMGVWAQITVGPSTGTYMDALDGTDDENGWAAYWKSSAKAADGSTSLLILQAPSGMDTSNGDIYANANAYTLNAPSGYVISGYTINGTATGGDVTITPAGGSGTTITSGNSLGEALSITVGAQSTTFTLSGSGHISSLNLVVTVSPILVTIAYCPSYTKSAVCSHSLPNAYGSFTGNSLFTTGDASGLAGVTVTASSGLTIGEQNVNVNAYGKCFSLTTGAAATNYTVTMQAPTGYVITGYYLGCSANSNNNRHTLTSADGSVVVEVTAPPNQNNTSKPFEVTDLNANSTHFTIRTANGGNPLYLPIFQIYVAKASEVVSDTYNVMFNGTQVATKTVTRRLGSSTTPAIPSSLNKSFCTYEYYSNKECTTPLSTLTTSGTTIYAKLTWNGPFTFSNDYASISNWYFLKLKNERYVTYEAASDPNVTLNRTSPNVDTRWAFVGNPYDGFKIYNKTAGSSVVLASATATSGNSGGNAHTRMVAVDNGTYTFNTWTIKTSNAIAAVTGFYIYNSEGYALNYRSDANLAYWTDGTGTGSTFSVEADNINFAESVAAYSSYFEDANKDKYFGISTSDAAELQGYYDSYSVTCTEDQYLAFCDAMNEAICIPATGYYRLKNKSASSYLGATSGVVGVTSGTGAETIIKLTNNGNGTFNMEVQGKYINISGQQYGGQLPLGDGAQVLQYGIPTAGSVVFSFAAGNWTYKSLFLDNGVVKNGLATAEASKWVVESATTVTIPLSTIGNYAYATTYLPFDVTITSGANAYVMAESGEWLVPTQLTDNKVPAGTPVLLRGTSGTASATATINTGYAFAAAEGNVLSGTYLAKDFALSGTPAATAEYFLGKKDGVLGFYHSGVDNASGSYRLGANKAYLAADPSSARGYEIMWDESETTGVNEVIGKMSEVTDGAIYDLQGRKVANPSRGMYIINGRVVVVK